MQLETHAVEKIHTICAAHGLSISDVALDGEVLSINPRALDEVPPPSDCRRIAEAIQALGYRYVTLQLHAGSQP
jgi:hypothetical protein